MFIYLPIRCCVKAVNMHTLLQVHQLLLSSQIVHILVGIREIFGDQKNLCLLPEIHNLLVRI